MKKKMGRPPIPKTQRKSEKVFFRATPAFRRALTDAAKREGKDLTTFIRDTLHEKLTGGE